MEEIAPPPVLVESPPPVLNLVFTAAQLRRRVRIACATALAITLPIIAVALYLNPSKEGSGSHTQLGLPPCGWYMTTGQPCPTCGCTTAVTHVIHGQLISGFITQPFGAIFGIVTVMTAILSLIGVITGKWYGPEPFWMGWHWRSILFTSLAIFFLAWGYKIMFVATAHG